MFRKNPMILTKYSKKKATASRQEEENEAEIKVCSEKTLTEVCLSLQDLPKSFLIFCAVTEKCVSKPAHNLK